MQKQERENGRQRSACSHLAMSKAVFHTIVVNLPRKWNNLNVLNMIALKNALSPYRAIFLNGFLKEVIAFKIV